jgi:hypothetical protein
VKQHKGLHPKPPNKEDDAEIFSTFIVVCVVLLVCCLCRDYSSVPVFEQPKSRALPGRIGTVFSVVVVVVVVVAEEDDAWMLDDVNGCMLLVFLPEL